MKALLHVNYHEGERKLRELFELAYRFGYDGVELRWKYQFPDLDQSGYRNLVAALKSTYPDMEIVFGGCIDFCCSASEEQLQDDIGDYGEFLDWSHRQCGTRVMNFFTGVLKSPNGREVSDHGSAVATDEIYARTAAGLRQVGKLASASGILIALETHNYYLHDLAPACRRLLDETGDSVIGLNYDQGNIIINRNGGSVADFFREVGDRIYYAHLKNLRIIDSGGRRGYVGCMLADGDIDNRLVVEKLHSTLKSGMLALEYPFAGDGIIAAKRDIEYFRFIDGWQFIGMCP